MPRKKDNTPKSADAVAKEENPLNTSNGDADAVAKQSPPTKENEVDLGNGTTLVNS